MLWLIVLKAVYECYAFRYCKSTIEKSLDKTSILLLLYKDI